MIIEIHISANHALLKAATVQAVLCRNTKHRCTFKGKLGSTAACAFIIIICTISHLMLALQNRTEHVFSADRHGGLLHEQSDQRPGRLLLWVERERCQESARGADLWGHTSRYACIYMCSYSVKDHQLLTFGSTVITSSFCSFWDCCFVHVIRCKEHIFWCLCGFARYAMLSIRLTAMWTYLLRPNTLCHLCLAILMSKATNHFCADIYLSGFIIKWLLHRLAFS